jgi:hypothetical protein
LSSKKKRHLSAVRKEYQNSSFVKTNKIYYGKYFVLSPKLFFTSFSQLSLTNQPNCKPKKFKAEDKTSMTDDDYLLAELNGHFE